MTFSDREQELEENIKIDNQLGQTGNFTRFCPPQVSLIRNSSKKTANSRNSNHNEPKMTRVRSMVDLRSQLFNRSIVAEINKRRLFKTIGAVENIGYSDFSGIPLAKLVRRPDGRSSTYNLSRQRI